MSKFQRLEDLAVKAKSLETLEEYFNTKLEENDIFNLKKTDEIKYDVGLSDFRRELIHEIEEELRDIAYKGKQEESLFYIGEIEYYLSNY